MISRTTAGVVAGVAGTLFIGYCIYFDRKRRSDPLFRQKLRERRRKNRFQGSKTTSSSGGKDIELPNLQDAEAVQRFFLNQVQVGEELLAQGDFDNGVEYFCNAVAVCGQPRQLLEVLHQSLPAPVFQLLVQKLPAVNKKIQAKAAEAMGGASVMPSGGATLREVDDVE